MLADCGAKVGTMSCRLPGIRFAHRMRELPEPTVRLAEARDDNADPNSGFDIKAG